MFCITLFGETQKDKRKPFEWRDVYLYVNSPFKIIIITILEFITI